MKTLSDKSVWKGVPQEPKREKFYPAKDVKQFIKALKNGFVQYGIKPEDVSMIVDQLAGDKLI